MKDVIIWGAGHTGKIAYEYLSKMYNCLFFVDTDSKKWDTEFCDKKVYSPDELKNNKNIKVVIASIFYEEILNDIEKYEIETVELFHINVNCCLQKSVIEELNSRTMDLGAFLNTNIKELSLKELTFIIGGSGVLDYAFLKVLAIVFNCKKYLEIGTYIGESINILSDFCEKLYSITAPMNAEFSMRKWCQMKNMPDFTERLTYSDKIEHYFIDSKQFDFTKVQDDIDLYFIDGDHSYRGVFSDTKNIFNTRKKDSIVVWHDFKSGGNVYNSDVVGAVRDVLKEDFKNVYVTNNNLCGVYIPEKYRDKILLREMKYEENATLYTYDLLINNLGKR